MNQLTPLTHQHYIERVSNLDNLTESEIRMDQYIQHHFNELSYYGIIDLANNANVSKATIGRFLNKIGFTGYAMFKNALRLGLTKEKIPAPIDTHQSNNDTITDRTSIPTQELMVNFTQRINELVESFSQEVNIKNLDQLTDLLIDNRRRLYVVGPSSSGAMALHFSTLIKYIREDVTVLSLDIGDLPKALVNIRENDILVIFSYYRFNRIVVDVAQWFKEKQASVVVVTNAVSHPYGKYSDLQFVLPSEANAIFQSRTIGFVFIELLLHLAYEKIEDEGNFNALEELFQFFKVNTE